jgi:hypothetical protein
LGLKAVLGGCIVALLVGVVRNGVMAGGTEPVVVFCSVCGEPMALETSKTDKAGQPVRSECYLCRLRREQKRPS